MYRQDLSLPASLGLDNGVYALMARTYLLRLAEAGGSRDPADLPPPAPKAGGCGHHH